MRWHYDLTHAEPIIKDLPVYDATSLAQGELLQLGATDPDSGADKGLALVTAYNATAANSATNAVGILNENTYASTAPDNDPASTGGPNYGKVIVNPFAVYMAEHSLAAADDVAITSTSGTTLTVASLADDIDGFYAYFPTATAGVQGSLRLLTASASGSATMDSALSVDGTASDTVVLIAPPTKYSFNLTSDGVKVASGDGQAAANATNLRVIETWIDKDEGIELLRPTNGNAVDDLDVKRSGFGPQFFYDIVLKDHAFGVQE